MAGFQGLHNAGPFQFFQTLPQTARETGPDDAAIRAVPAFVDAVQGRRQMLGQHQALAAQKQRGALHDVLQLADIAGPGVTLEHIHHGQGKAHVLPPVGRGEFCNKMTGQGQDILGAQAQRRQRNGKDIQAVEQITAEAPLLHHPFQVAVGGGDEAHVHMSGFHAAQAFKAAFLQNAQ